MRTIHRITMMFAVIFTLYLGVTGSIIQTIDLRAILKHAPATDPNILSIREGISGPSNFVVLNTADYTAAALPTSFNPRQALATVLKSAPATPLDYIEFRMANGQPVGQVLTQGRLLRFDAITGAALSPPAVPPAANMPGGPRSPHDQIKSLHRMDFYGDWALWLNFATGLALFVMILTGLLLYFKLLGDRARRGRHGLFWAYGGAWRALHRAVSLIAATFLLVVAITGMLLAWDNIASTHFLRTSGKPMFGPDSPVMGNQASPLPNAALPAWLRTTLAAYDTNAPNPAIKVLRLRIFAGQPQGVIITAKHTQQLVFNALTGKTAREYEPGYPVTGFPFGWDEHELVKRIHRGDYFGLTGRWMDLFAGLSLIFLSVSALVMYLDLWSKRRNLGRSGLFWR